MGDSVDRVKKGQARSASLACRKQKYADQEFLASLGYIERPCLKTDIHFFKIWKTNKQNAVVWDQMSLKSIPKKQTMFPGLCLKFFGSRIQSPSH